MRGALVLVSLVALLVGACGESSNDAAADNTGAAQTTSTTTNETDPALEGLAEPAEADDQGAADPDAAADAHAQAEAAITVVRAWSTALNADENETAASLFASDALVVQGSTTIPLPDMDAAVRFNAGLPCSGHIVDVRVKGQVVTAVFELGHRLSGMCDAEPGTLAAADFLIEDGRILIWQLVPVPAPRRVEGSRNAA